MTVLDEDGLEAGCAVGDPSALDTAVELLSSPHPYTRARASEMLALAPEIQLAGLLADEFGRGFPSALWWRVVALFGQQTGRAPGAERLCPLIEELFSTTDSPNADALFHALGALSSAAVPGRAELGARWVSHGDDEIALRAVMVVAEERSLGDAETTRLRSVRGEERLHALVLLAEHGDTAAVGELVEAVPGAGPFAYHALDTVERHGTEAALQPLRRLWDTRFLASHVAARAAGTAASLGDAAAIERLRALTRALRRDTRAVAWSELARTGSAEDLAAVAERVHAGRREAAFVVAELWRRAGTEADGVIGDALRHPDPEIRIAGCEAASHRLAVDGLTAALRSMSNDPDSAVRTAAERALAGPTDSDEP